MKEIFEEEEEGTEPDAKDYQSLMRTPEQLAEKYRPLKSMEGAESSIGLPKSKSPEAEKKASTGAYLQSLDEECSEARPEFDELRISENLEALNLGEDSSPLEYQLLDRKELMDEIAMGESLIDCDLSHTNYFQVAEESAQAPVMLFTIPGASMYSKLENTELKILIQKYIVPCVTIKNLEFYVVNRKQREMVSRGTSPIVHKKSSLNSLINFLAIRHPSKPTSNSHRSNPLIFTPTSNRKNRSKSSFSQKNQKLRDFSNESASIGRRLLEKDEGKEKNQFWRRKISTSRDIISAGGLNRTAYVTDRDRLKRLTQVKAEKHQPPRQKEEVPTRRQSTRNENKKSVEAVRKTSARAKHFPKQQSMAQAHELNPGNQFLSAIQNQADPLEMTDSEFTPAEKLILGHKPCPKRSGTPPISPPNSRFLDSEAARKLSLTLPTVSNSASVHMPKTSLVQKVMNKLRIPLSSLQSSHLIEKVEDLQVTQGAQATQISQRAQGAQISQGAQPTQGVQGRQYFFSSNKASNIQGDSTLTSSERLSESYGHRNDIDRCSRYLMAKRIDSVLAKSVISDNHSPIVKVTDSHTADISIEYSCHINGDIDVSCVYL